MPLDLKKCVFYEFRGVENVMELFKELTGIDAIILVKGIRLCVESAIYTFVKV